MTFSLYHIKSNFINKKQHHNIVILPETRDATEMIDVPLQ